MTNKFTVIPLQQGRFIDIEGVFVMEHSDAVTLTRSEATELRDELTRALRKSRTR